MKKISFTHFAIILTVLLAVSSCATNSTSQNKIEAAPPAELNWQDNKVPSLYETYKDYFDYVGIACEYGPGSWSTKELATAEVQLGLLKHANTITMGNELKPQFVMQWWGNNPKIEGTFTASNGITITTPKLSGMSNVDAVLSICQMMGIQIRGHVLVWHSQTEDAFFYEDYNKSKKLVDKDTMTARQEWYIKTLVEHVQDFEKKRNNGKKIVWAWDVVNEAIADGSSNLRSQGSKWYEIYKSDEFILNAFRFANKYVNEDVVLCYNDYGCTNAGKRKGMINLLNKIMAAENDEVLPTRINAMGMQSHISVNTAPSLFQSAVNDFLATGLDVQITELDIATETNYNPQKLADVYYNYFTLFLNNRKTPDKNGISAITIWGINDESTWLNSDSQIRWHGNTTQYPLLFKYNDKKEYVVKPAFDAVIKAAKDFQEN